MIVVKIIKQVLSCVNYLHSKDIAHRDLKLENILLEVPKNFDSVKVIDFGTAHEITGGFMTEIVGTPYYIAPEVFSKKYTKACDLWSVGVIAYTLLSNYPPFNAATDLEVIDFVKAGKYTFDAPVWETVSASAKDFIS